MSESAKSINLCSVAKAYIKKGLSVHPLIGKIPMSDWKVFSERMMTEEEIEEYFSKATGIGIIGGDISGGKAGFALEILDIDAKNFIDKTKYQRFVEKLPQDLFDKMVVAETINKGYHFYYRTDSEIVGGSTRLASREATEEEKKDGSKILVEFETRGQVSYCVSVPSDGYTIISTNKKINYITREEHSLLFDLVGEFNEVFDEVESYNRIVAEKEGHFILSPFEDYNQRGELLSVLTNAGWTVAYSKKEEIRVKRPGKSSATSGIYSVAKNRLKVFSTSSELEGGKNYSASEIYCRFVCGGDWSKCYRSLIEKGFGKELNYDVAIHKHIDMIKRANPLELLQDKFPESVITNGKFFFRGKEYKI